MMENIKKLADNCAEQIMTYPVVTGKDKVKRIIKQNILQQKMAPVDGFSWPNAMLGEGLLAAFEVTADKKYLAAVVNYLEQWKKSGYRINYVDNLMNGSLAMWIEELIEEKAAILYSETEKTQILTMCQEAADACAVWVRNAKKTKEGILAYRDHHPNWIFADTIGMLCPFACRYGIQKKDEELLNLGILQMQSFLKNGMDRRTGLPYHGYDENSGIKYGIIGWGRACGWLMKGIAESIRWIPSKMREKRQLKLAFWSLKDSAAKYQRRDGGFSWQLQAVDGPVDVSAGAMIGNAIWKISEKSEVKPETLKTQEQLSESFMISITGGEVRNCSGECRGFAEYPQVYGTYPWGSGSVLYFLALKADADIELKNRPEKLELTENLDAEMVKSAKMAGEAAETVKKPKKKKKPTNKAVNVEKTEEKAGDIPKVDNGETENVESENGVVEAEKRTKRKRYHKKYPKKSNQSEVAETAE